MPTVNGMEMPMRNQSGLLVLEEPSGHQVWSLITDATVEYDHDTEVSYGSSPQFKVIATMPPGELLRAASTVEVDEVNALMYSRLLVAVLREERDRYAELERELIRERQWRAEAVARKDDVLNDRAEMLHAAWADGARNGYVASAAGLPVETALERNPHPEPEDETDGCHICGGPDH